jgi:uncharacterized protein YkwD
VTRHGALLATTVPIFACACFGAPAAGAVAHDVGRAQKASRSPAAAPRASANGHLHARIARPRHALRSCVRPDSSRSRQRKPVLACRARTRSATLRGSHRRYPRAVPRVVTLPSSAERPQAVTIARVLATPCQNTALTPEPADLALIRAAVLCLINKERAQSGENPLKEDAQLEAAAESHSEEMISSDYFEHVSPSGVTPVDRVRSAGYLPGPEVGYVIGENLAWGTLSLATPQAIVAAWIGSPGHLANILESRYRDTGIGVAPEVPASLSGGAPGATYAQEFGVIID